MKVNFRKQEFSVDSGIGDYYKRVARKEKVILNHSMCFKKKKRLIEV